MSVLPTPDLRAPFPWFGEPPLIGMAVALDLITRGILRVDEEGRIWRCAANSRSGWRLLAAERRAENVGGKGYLRLTLQHEGKQVQAMAHRVVWAIKHKQIPPEDRQINHDDLDKKNNQPCNLILCTGQENIQHSYAHGRTRPWSKVVDRPDAKWRGRPIVDESTKHDIRLSRASGSHLKQIAERFRISISHVHRICR